MTNDSRDPLFHDEAPPSMLARILPPLVLISAFGGFIALAIYAYQAGTQSVNEGELMVVEAETTPMKEKPEDPGGMQFPNQDKTIFETFSANGKQPAKVERVLPTPEEPMQKEAVPSAQSPNWANEKMTATPAAPEGAEKIFGVEDDAPAAPVQPQVMNVQEELGKQAVAEAAAATPATAAEVQLKVKEAQAEAVKVVEKPVEKPVAKPVEKVAAKPKPKAAAKGLVQLGAYHSEAEAKGDFVKLQKKHAALSGKSPTINRADLGDKGIFYRLRVSTDDAKKLCATLAASGQACMAVK